MYVDVDSLWVIWVWVHPRVLRGVLFIRSCSYCHWFHWLISHARTHTQTHKCHKWGFYFYFCLSSIYFLGFITSSMVCAILNSVLSAQQMLDWGWRLPYLIAILPGAASVYYSYHRFFWLLKCVSTKFTTVVLIFYGVERFIFNFKTNMFPHRLQH